MVTSDENQTEMVVTTSTRTPQPLVRLLTPTFVPEQVAKEIRRSILSGELRLE